MAIDLTQSFASDFANQTLQEVYTQLEGDEQTDIPFLVWLLENPASPLALPGKIDLRNHDYIHILLGRGQLAQDEAFVVGFTMGNDLKTNWLHLLLFKIFARFLYPEIYRLTPDLLKVFDLGFDYGRRLGVKQLNTFNFEAHQQQAIGVLRQQLGIIEQDIRLLRRFESWLLNGSVTTRSRPPILCSVE